MSTKIPSPVPGISPVRARGIMGNNCLGLEEVYWHYARDPDPEQYAEIPFSEETLQACKDTHVLVAGAPLTLNDVRMIDNCNFYPTYWYRHEPFANDTTSRPLSSRKRRCRSPAR